MDGSPFGLAAKIAMSVKNRGKGNPGLDQHGGPRSAFAEAMDGHPDNPANQGGGGNGHPEYGDWSDAQRAEQEARNLDAISAAEVRQDYLESQGFHYNDSNGTWVSPDGRTTTLFAGDHGPPGGVDYHWQDDAGAPPGGSRDAYGDESPY